MIERILLAITGNGAITGAATLVSFIQAGADLFEYIQEKYRERADAKELFKDIFVYAACQTLIGRLQEKGLLSPFQSAVQRKPLKKSAGSFNFTQYLHTPADGQEAVMREYYVFLFERLREKVQEMELSRDADLDKLFDGADKEAYDKWLTYFSEACRKYPQLLRYVQGAEKISNAEQLQGAQFPSRSFGAHEHPKARRVSGEYWEQNIELFSKSVCGQESQEQELPKREIPARPVGDSACVQAWWQDLAQLLSQSPIFLTGPGGMGKSAFLAYLYDTVAQNSPDCPFEGAFLISLDTLIAKGDPVPGMDQLPFDNPDASVLLRCIASLSGNDKVCRGWNAVLSGQYRFVRERPILILLDGFNEMQARRPAHENLYKQILDELEALLGRERFPFVRLILTSRVDAPTQREEQQKELPAVFRPAELKGIQETVPAVRDQLNKDMQELLCRPMYHRCILDGLKQGKTFSNQYQVLREMYRAMTGQAVENTVDETQKRFFRHIMDYLLPIIAYHEQKDKPITQEKVEDCCKEIMDWLPALQSVYASTFHEKSVLSNSIRFFPSRAGEIGEFLASQEQIIIYDPKEGYIFQHQDYRDYLVAEYFLQRMEFMKARDNLPLWNQEEAIVSLSLNTYGPDILRLIYQAVHFSEKPAPGEVTAFVKQFSLEKDELKHHGLTAGLVLWYTTPYQLADLQALARVHYGGKDLNGDTLKILQPLVDTVCHIQRKTTQLQTVRAFHPRLRQNLIEILMKACELYRNRQDLDKVRQITAAVNQIYPRTRKRSHSRADWMYHVVDHNIIMAELADFMISGRTDRLKDTMAMLRRCTARVEEGKQDIPPFRFSCLLLGQILISPQPKLLFQDEYQKLKDEISKEDPPEVAAFWLYYDALYDPRKEGESWLIRSYALRQFLFLLAENKVQIAEDLDLDLDTVSLQFQDELGRGCVTVPQPPSPIPTEQNLRLIRRFLKEIEGVIEADWVNYLTGLVCYLLDGKEKAAMQNFSATAKSDVRAHLWLAYLSKDPVQLKSACDEGRPKSAPSSPDANRYDMKYYYDRDFTTLYAALNDMLTLSV